MTRASNSKVVHAYAYVGKPVSLYFNYYADSSSRFFVISPTLPKFTARMMERPFPQTSKWLKLRPKPSGVEPKEQSLAQSNVQF